MGATDRNTNSGLVQVTIYGPRGKGMGAIMAKADAARNVYDRAEFSGVRCASADAPRPTPHDEWAVRIVRVPFTVDETT